MVCLWTGCCEVFEDGFWSGRSPARGGVEIDVRVGREGGAEVRGKVGDGDGVVGAEDGDCFVVVCSSRGGWDKREKVEMAIYLAPSHCSLTGSRPRLKRVILYPRDEEAFSERLVGVG